MSVRLYSTWRAAMAKSVCVIGAGPSGLVAAKNLLYNVPTGQFKVTVFDSQKDIGGLWPTSKTDSNRQIHPFMVANQSKHTMQFSDLSWQKDVPQLPQAWMVGQYLQRYMEKYLTNNANFELQLGHRITSTNRSDRDKWDVTVAHEDKSEQRSFDYLLIASGYFNSPIVPPYLTDNASVPVIHSCDYRTIEQLLGKEPRKARTILVVGGQMSGVEIAGTIASHLSALSHAPNDSDIPDISEYKIHHVIQRPIWVFPLHTSLEPTKPGPPFLPLDFSSYNRNNRPLPVENNQGHITEPTAKAFHGIFERALGTNQATFSNQLFADDAARSKPPYLAVSDWYCDFVRSGSIHLSTSKVKSVNDSSAILEDGSRIDDIAAVVVATGFDASPSLDFLPKPVLDTIHFAPKDPDQVSALAFHATHHPDITNLGFVGYYRSPYWGVMQMQARFLSTLWSDKPKTEAFTNKVKQDDSIQRALALRDDPQRSQFPMGDYAYLMQEFAEALSMEISPQLGPDRLLSHNNLPLNALTPARYSILNEDGNGNLEAQSLLQDTATVAEGALTSSRFVSRAVFRSLLGTWSLERDLDSKLPTHPSGHFSGKAQFLLRRRTEDGLQCATSDVSIESGDTESDWEYLYIEDGEFKTQQGFGFRATRRYVYRYDEATDKLSVWFAHPEHQKRADYLFHEVEFETADEKSGWKAKSGHLCIDDYYDVKYNFAFQGVNLDNWTCAYTVNGPKKDYTIRGTYTR